MSFTSQKFYKDFFKDHESTYDNKERYDKIIKILKRVGYNDFSVVLDIGVGSGEISSRLRSCFSINQIICLDIIMSSDFMQVYNTNRNKLYPIIASVAYLPFRSSIFNLTIFSEIIEHLENDEQSKSIANLNEMISNQGLILLTTPNPASIHFMIEKFMYFLKYRKLNYIRKGQVIENWIHPKSLKLVLTEYFNIKYSGGTYYLIPHIYYPSINKYFIRISEYLSEKELLKSLGLYQYYILTKKECDD